MTITKELIELALETWYPEEWPNDFNKADRKALRKKMYSLIDAVLTEHWWGTMG